MRECRPLVTDHIAGMVLGMTVLILLPPFIIAGAIDCASTKPGLHCTLVQFALDDGAAGRTLPVEQAKFDY
jgi:hypothetical protein